MLERWDRVGCVLTWRLDEKRTTLKGPLNGKWTSSMSLASIESWLLMGSCPEHLTGWCSNKVQGVPSKSMSHFSIYPKCGQVALILSSVHVYHVRVEGTSVSFCGSEEIAGICCSSLRKCSPHLWIHMYPRAMIPMPT